MEQQNLAEMENSKQEKSKLKAYKVIQKKFANLGITLNLVGQSCPFNGTILLNFLTLGSIMYSTIAYIIYDAETFAEYIQCIYCCSIGILATIALLVMILNVEILFEFINGCDILLNTSELGIKQKTVSTTI